VSRRPRPLAEVLPGFRSRLAPATVLAGVQARWAEVVGERIAREAEPVSERGGVLTVRCVSAVWASELSLMAPDLLERLNDGRPEGTPALVALRFTAGARERPSSP
jgi:predicted nucleic acid-binding Zn ribbon protein